MSSITRADLEVAMRKAIEVRDAEPECDLAAAFLGYLWRRVVVEVAWERYAAARGLDPKTGAPLADPARGSASPPATGDDAGGDDGRGRPST